MGDGLRYALAYLMQLATHREAYLILEEPELHMHPGLMGPLARAVVEAYTMRGNQVFISTHSLEFIDMIIEESGKLELKGSEVRFYRTTLGNGVLEAEQYSLDEAEELRRTLDYDLR